MKLNIRKFQKGGSSKLPTFSLPEINIYPQNRFGDIARSQGLETARNWRKVREGTTAGINEFVNDPRAQFVQALLPLPEGLEYLGMVSRKAITLFANRPYRVSGTLKLDKPIQTVGEVSNRAALTKSAEQMGADGVIFNNVYDNGYSNNQVIFSFKDLIDGITTKKAAGK